MKKKNTKDQPAETSEVLVVGGGPTGLFSAITLARMGVPVTLIERRTELTSGSKALSLSPLSAHLLHEAGAISPFLGACRRTSAFNVHFAGKRLNRIDFNRLATRYPFFLMQPQPDTERMLEEHLAGLGVAVERGTAFLGLRQDANGVSVLLGGEHGAPLERRFSYVIGCDGARSSVRQAMGAGFSGHDYSGMHFILADCEVEWDGALNEAHYFVTEAGFMVLAPLSDTHNRVVIQVKAPFVGGRMPPFSDFLERAARIAPPGLKLKNPAWISSAPFYNRLASRSAIGRVFLAGDATHLFCPLGGMGMNTGLGDALNIAWKIGYVMNEHAPASLLKSYETERLGIAAQLVAQTDLSTSMAARLNRHTREDEQKLLPRFANRELLRRQQPLQASGLGQAYSSPLGGHLAPYVEGISFLGGNDTLDLFKGLRHVLLIGAGTEEDARQAERRAVEIRAEFGGFLTTYVVTQEPTRAEGHALRVLDPKGALAGAYDLARRPFALVRPDSYVEIQTGNFHALQDHLRAHYARPVRSQELHAATQ